MKMVIARLLFNRKLCTAANVVKRSVNSRELDIAHKNHLFNLELKRQRDVIGRLEKIEVNLHYYKNNQMMLMNKSVSTPYECTRHINETLMKNAVVALMNGERLWHMHKPLEEACNLEILNFFIEDPSLVNKIFWRSCSFILGAVLTNLFKDNVHMLLHSFPSPNVRSGSFVYDIELDLDNWTPRVDELKLLSLGVINMVTKDYKIECLDVSKELALDMFRENRFKMQQIPNIAEQNNNKVPLYRINNHIDISKGPMISSSSQIGRCTISAVHKIGTNFYRVQGVALPHLITLNHYAYHILEERSKKLNPAKIPSAIV